MALTSADAAAKKKPPPIGPSQRVVASPSAAEREAREQGGVMGVEGQAPVEGAAISPPSGELTTGKADALLKMRGLIARGGSLFVLDQKRCDRWTFAPIGTDGSQGTRTRDARPGLAKEQLRVALSPRAVLEVFDAVGKTVRGRYDLSPGAGGFWLSPHPPDLDGYAVSSRIARREAYLDEKDCKHVVEVNERQAH